MDAYGSFAMVYDLFMDNVDYDGWSDYLRKLLRRYGVEDGLILELGCGTGSMTERLAEAGFDMIGVDCSGICGDGGRYYLFLGHRGTGRIDKDRTRQ